MIPSQLELQVSFEIDDGLYELHGLTEVEAALASSAIAECWIWNSTIHDGNDRSSSSDFGTNFHSKCAIFQTFFDGNTCTDPHSYFTLGVSK